MAAAVFTVDLTAWETACAAADSCTFDKTAYEPLAFGFLWGDDNIANCDSVNGPYIMNKPDANALPFEGLYWNGGVMGFDLGVTYDAATHLFAYSTFVDCAPFDFLDGCFADLRANDFKLAFSLLKSTVGLEEGTT
jgi:hypothetical protein